ncbi:hypothetical protein MMC11_003659 [Xylographa trunciseda]|nr:hypothetical protein [Xylographa trunciseda]
MPTIKTLVIAVLSTLTISSAQLDARHPNAGLSESYLSDHDLYARAEPELRTLDVRDPIFGSRIIKSIIKGAEKGNNAAQQYQSSQNRRRNADAEADPIFGSRIIKSIIKGAEKGNNAAQHSTNLLKTSDARRMRRRRRRKSINASWSGRRDSIRATHIRRLIGFRFIGSSDLQWRDGTHVCSYNDYGGDIKSRN